MSKKKELRYQNVRELRVQTSPDGSRAISGYAIVYNSPSGDLGGFKEIVSPGALTDTLRDNPDILCLRDHDAKQLMGRTKSGTLTLTDDGVGLRFACTLPKTSQANDLTASIERGDLDGVSFGFTVPSEGDIWSNDGTGNVVRTLLKINLFEISPCSFPAYPSSSVSVRSCPAELRGLLSSRFANYDDECECDCPECLNGNCEGCSDSDCDDPNCDNGERTRRLRLALAIAQRS